MGFDLAQLATGPLSVRRHTEGDPIPERAEDLLRQLGGPTLILIPGQDASRVRVVSTLLHGNEPSGLFALHHWLQSSDRPAVTIAVLVAQVGTALQAPGFAWRSLPGEPDLNRCFSAPFVGASGELATAILRAVECLRPEALIDIHNTSCRGPAYAVTTSETVKPLSLASLFCDMVVLTHLRMGTLINATESLCPSVVVEVGGSQDPSAHQVARRGLERFVSSRELFIGADAGALQILRHPVRVLLRPGATVDYGDCPNGSASVTLRSNVFELNFTPTPPGTELGWVGPQGLDALVAKDDDGVERVTDLFVSVDGRLKTRRSIQFFMITTEPAIAQQDCLFYAVALD